MGTHRVDPEGETLWDKVTLDSLKGKIKNPRSSLYPPLGVPTMGSKIPHNKLSGFFILIFW